MKKIAIIGVGAQGSAAAKKLDQEPQVSELICADQDQGAIDQLVSGLSKAKGARIDAHSKESIVRAAEGADLVINGLPLEYGPNVLDAALEIHAHYQDYAGTTELYDAWRNSPQYRNAVPPDLTDPVALEWYDSLRAQYEIYGPKFKEIDRLAIFGTGSAPGLICAATRDAMKYLDSCDTIYNIVWEGIRTRRFVPFWWSPITAMNDMSEIPVAVEDGRLINTEPFGRPVQRQYPGMEHPVIFREHSHDEPIQYYFHRDTLFKGAKNIYFKYAGEGMDLCRSLTRAGLMRREPEWYQGRELVPFDYVMAHIPPAPKYKREIQEIIEEGILSDPGCMVVEAYGKKDRRNMKVEAHIIAPGLLESFQREGISAEMYLTGQAGYLFSRLFLEDALEQRGLISSDMLTQKQIDLYFRHAAELGITMETTVKEI